MSLTTYRLISYNNNNNTEQNKTKTTHTHANHKMQVIIVSVLGMKSKVKVKMRCDRELTSLVSNFKVRYFYFVRILPFSFWFYLLHGQHFDIQL